MIFLKKSIFKKYVTILTIASFVFGSGSFGLPNLARAQTEGGFSECDDSLDNDSDGLYDYPEDPDCVGYYGSEFPVAAVVYSAPQPVRTNSIDGNKYTFREPGTHSVTIPDGMYEVKVKSWGAGGGGGTGMKTPNQHVSGFGGGAGGYSENIVAVVPGQTIDVIVGMGGLYGEGGSNSEASINGGVISGAGGGGGGLSVGGPGYKDKSSFWRKIAMVVISVVLTYISAGVLGPIVNGFTNLVVTNATMNGIISGYISGQINATLVSKIADQIPNRDPRKPGGVDGLPGYGFGGVPGGLGAGLGGSWIQSSPTGGGGGGPRPPINLNFLPDVSVVLSYITFSKLAFAQSWQPVFGTGGDGYAGYQKNKGGDGGPYSFRQSNPFASNGGSAFDGGAGGFRGRLGRDGNGHCRLDRGHMVYSGDGKLYPCDHELAKVQDGKFPGGGGGGSDTGTGGYGADGQVYIELLSGITGSVPPQCRDSIDNDADGLIDYPLDTGCENVNDDDESNLPNNSPSTPQLSCPISIPAGQSGSFTAVSSDQDNDNISYLFNWGDGGTTLVSNVISGQTARANKSWSSQGQKNVTVTASDRHGAGTQSSSCLVLVTAPLPNNPMVSILANPMSIVLGDTANLSWVSDNVSMCTASGGWTGTKALSDWESVSPLVTTTYTLTCEASGGNNPNPPNPNPPPPSGGPTENTCLSYSGDMRCQETIYGNGRFDFCNDQPINFLNNRIALLSESAKTSATSAHNQVAANPIIQSGIDNPTSTGFGEATATEGGYTISYSWIYEVDFIPRSVFWTISGSSGGDSCSVPPPPTTPPPTPPPTSPQICVRLSAGGCPVNAICEAELSDPGSDLVVDVTCGAATPCVGYGTSNYAVTDPGWTIIKTAGNLTGPNSWSFAKVDDSFCSFSGSGSNNFTWDPTSPTNRTVVIDSVTVTVLPAPLCTDVTATNYNQPGLCVFGPLAPTVTLEILPSSVAPGSSSDLRWSSNGATACTASNGWTGARALFGSESTGSLWANKTYTLTCSNSVGVAQGTVSVSVGGSTTACSDGLDNDGDGLIDINDQGCWIANVYDPNRNTEVETPILGTGINLTAEPPTLKVKFPINGGSNSNRGQLCVRSSGAVNFTGDTTVSYTGGDVATRILFGNGSFEDNPTQVIGVGRCFSVQFQFSNPFTGIKNFNFRAVTGGSNPYIDTVTIKVDSSAGNIIEFEEI